MNLHTIALLEFETILKKVHSYSLSEQQTSLELETYLGSGLIPTTPETLEPILQLALWFDKAIAQASSYPYLRWNNNGPIWDQIHLEGSVAQGEDLGRIMEEASAIEAFLSWVRSTSETVPPQAHGSLTQILANLGPITKLGAELSKYLEPSGIIKEDSIPELKKAKARISSMQQELRQSASKLIKDIGPSLNGDFATIRDGRTVLPLKAGFKSQVPGFIHGSSSSGETIFIEPFELVERNNAVMEAEGAYLQEVHKLFRRLTNLCRENATALNHLRDQANILHAGWVRGRYARAVMGHFVQAHGELNLMGVRHPQLGSKAIPISITIPSNKRFLIISGPNTGGKTVTLKTLGLSVLMRQCGIPLSCIPESSLPWFTDVLADIGDEQSITNDLSTFSGHLVRIRECIEQASDTTLVLLDELGSGTDPEEGAALAVALGHGFLQKKCLTVTSSHFGSLKALGYALPEAMNASMAYSAQEGKPTYQIIPGLPGASHAIDTAERIGIPKEIIQQARNISQGRGDPAYDLVMRLTQEHQELQVLQQKLKGQESTLDQREVELQRTLEQVAKERLELQNKQYTEASMFLATLRSKAESILQELDSAKKRLINSPEPNQVNGPTQLEMVDTNGIRSILADLTKELDQKKSINASSVRLSTGNMQLSPGLNIRVSSTGRTGTVIREGKKGQVEVEIQGKRFHLPKDDLEVLAQQPRAEKPKIHHHVEARQPAVFTLDVRGQRLSEVVEIVEKQIDSALLSNLGFFSIIHGKGEGVLQKAIHDYLKTRREVSSFHFAHPEDGGTGKTLVYLG